MINDVKMLKIYATPCGNDPILYSRVNSFMTCKNLTSATEKPRRQATSSSVMVISLIGRWKLLVS